jgi:hypothetical protein
MQKSEPTRKTGYGRGAFVTVVLATVFFLFNSDQPLREGILVMAKVAAADGIKKAGRASSVPLARDPAIAVAEEYELARQQGTVQALELFIARHGDDSLAVKARAELLRLSR